MSKSLPQDFLDIHQALLDVLGICRQSASNLEAFRDFKVRRDRVTRALIWLKENNSYYADIIIDYGAFQSLPLDGSIDDRLRDINNDDENEDEVMVLLLEVPSIKYRMEICGRR